MRQEDRRSAVLVKQARCTDRPSARGEIEALLPRRALRLRFDYVEHVLPDLGQHLGVAAAGCPLVQEHLGRHRKALAGDSLLPAQLVELPAEVVASPPSDE